MNIKEELEEYIKQHAELMKAYSILKDKIIRIEGIIGFLQNKLKEEGNNASKEESI